MIVTLLGHQKHDFAMEIFAARSKESDSPYFEEKVNENNNINQEYN